VLLLLLLLMMMMTASFSESLTCITAINGSLYQTVTNNE